MKSDIIIPESYNYIGVFLTFACTLKCSYCINTYHKAKPAYPAWTGEQWVENLNRIQTRPDLPLSFQGGEPTLHPDFYGIISSLRTDLPIDLLTNGEFDIDEFMDNIPPQRFASRGKYASIRFSYHPEKMDFFKLVAKVRRMQDEGYSVGVWGVAHPKYTINLGLCKQWCRIQGIDYREKEFLGEYEGKMYGTYKYPECMNGSVEGCYCKPSEMLIAPDGQVHRCHRDLYSGYQGYASIADEEVRLPEFSLPCSQPDCNPCDLKVKTDRHQVYGHTSVEITNMVPVK